LSTPGRQAGLLEDTGDQRAGHRRLLGRLQDKGVSRRQRVDNLFHREQERRIEWSDPRDDAKRLAHGDRKLPGHGHGHGFAHHMPGIAGGRA